MAANGEGPIGQYRHATAGQFVDPHLGPLISLQRERDYRLGIEGIGVGLKAHTGARVETPSFLRSRALQG